MSNLEKNPETTTATAEPAAKEIAKAVAEPKISGKRLEVGEESRANGQFLYIGLDALIPSPTNPRKHFDKQELEELAASFGSEGQLQNLVVRALPDKYAKLRKQSTPKQAYEIVTGERRFRAGEVAKVKTLFCIVRDLTDQQVIRIQIIENLQRKDINALEEAQGYYTLSKEAGYTKKFLGKDVPDVERIAREIGKSGSYVYSRLQLLNKLTKPIIDAVLANHITTTHAVEIARLEPKDQLRALAYCLQDPEFYYEDDEDTKPNIPKKPKCMQSVDSLSDWIKQEIQQSLSGAPWKKDDAQLCPNAGACNLCSKRTDYLVSPEKTTGQSQCLDPQCYREKKNAFIKVKEEELKAAQGVVVKYASDYRDSRRAEEKGEKVLHEHSVREVKPNSKGAVLALDVSTGRTKHILPEEFSPDAKRAIEQAKRTDPETGKVEAKPSAPLKEREKVLAQRRVAWINDHLREKVLPKTDLDSFIQATGDAWGVRLIQVAASFGTQGNAGTHYYGQKNPWSFMVDFEGEKKTENVAKGSGVKLWKWIVPVLQERLKYFRVGDVEPREAQNAATLIGQDWAALEKLAADALPEPKGWAAERAGSKKPESAVAKLKAAAKKKASKPKAKKAAKAKK